MDYDLTPVPRHRAPHLAPDRQGSGLVRDENAVQRALAQQGPQQARINRPAPDEGRAQPGQCAWRVGEDGTLAPWGTDGAPHERTYETQ